MSAVTRTDERVLGYHFAAVPDWVLRHSELDAQSVRIFGLMARYSEAFPSLALLAKDCVCSIDTVRRAIRRLEVVGAVLVVPRYRPDGGRSSNAYHLAGDTPLAPVPEPPLADTPPGPLAPVPGQEVENSLERENPKTKPSRDLVLATPPADLFEQFWQAYPRKVGKPPARKAFTHALIDVDVGDIASGLRAWCSYWTLRGEEEFIPHPTTWLNQQRWNDRPPSPPHSETPEEQFARLFPDSVNGSHP